MNILFMVAGLSLLRSLIQFRNIMAFSCSELMETFSKWGFSLCWPKWKAFSIFVDKPKYCWRMFDTQLMSSCFLATPSSLVDSAMLWKIRLSLHLDFSFSSLIKLDNSILDSSVTRADGAAGVWVLLSNVESFPSISLIAI